MLEKLARLTDDQRAAIHRRSEAGEALFLWELTVVSGYSYSTLQKWRREGLPLVDGKLPWKEAWEWRKAYVRAGEEAALRDRRARLAEFGFKEAPVSLGCKARGGGR